MVSWRGQLQGGTGHLLSAPGDRCSGEGLVSAHKAERLSLGQRGRASVLLSGSARGSPLQGEVGKVHGCYAELPGQDCPSCSVGLVHKAGLNKSHLPDE